MVVADVLRQFNDAVGLTAQSANGCGIVECITGDGQSVDTPVADVLVRTLHTIDDTLPRPRIDAVDDNPYSHNGDEPVACPADMLP